MSAPLAILEKVTLGSAWRLFSVSSDAELAKATSDYSHSRFVEAQRSAPEEGGCFGLGQALLIRRTLFVR